jgi:hypothetical protein
MNKLILLNQKLDRIIEMGDVIRAQYPGGPWGAMPDSQTASGKLGGLENRVGQNAMDRIRAMKGSYNEARGASLMKKIDSGAFRKIASKIGQSTRL